MFLQNKSHENVHFPLHCCPHLKQCQVSFTWGKSISTEWKIRSWIWKFLLNLFLQPACTASTNSYTQKKSGHWWLSLLSPGKSEEELAASKSPWEQHQPARLLVAVTVILGSSFLAGFTERFDDQRVSCILWWRNPGGPHTSLRVSYTFLLLHLGSLCQQRVICGLGTPGTPCLRLGV